MATLSRATPWGAFSELSFGAGLQILMVVKLRLFLVYHVCLGAGCDLGQMFLSLFFGLSTNYYLALIIRTLWGFTNGNLGVLKTYVSETCSEDMQSLGFSIIVTMGGIAKFGFSAPLPLVWLVPVWVASLAMPSLTSPV